MASSFHNPLSPKGHFKLLVAGFGALLVMMVAVIGISIVTMHHHQNQLDEVVGERMAKVSLALTMRKAARERTLSLTRLLLENDPFLRDEEWLRFNAFGAEFAEARLALLALPLSETEQWLLDEQGELTREAVPFQRKVVNRIEQGDRENAALVLAYEAIPAQNAVIAKVDEFDREQRAAAAAAQAQASQQLSQARMLILVLGVGAVTVGLVIAIIVTRLVRQRSARDAYLATHDPLTGLPNRTLLMDRLHHSLNRRERQGGGLGLLFIDLDLFKDINDTYGHAAGDQVLLSVAERIGRQLRKSDTLARLSGDEFVALLDEVTDAAAVEATAQRVVECCGRPVRVHGKEIPLSVSVGIALYPQHGRTQDELLSHGDTAMYRSKQGGRNRWQVYQGGGAG